MQLYQELREKNIDADIFMRKFKKQSLCLHIGHHRRAVMTYQALD